MRRLWKWLIAVGCGLAAAPGWSTGIQYDVTNVAGSTWQYDFSVANDSLSVPIGEFTLFFDYDLFSNLVAVSQPGEYDGPLVIQPVPPTDPIFPLAQDGFVDYLALDAGLAPGGTLDHFIVDADFSGSGTPRGPSFQVVDAAFNVLDSGSTSASASGPTAVPEPGTLGLLIAGLLGVAVVVLTGQRPLRGARRA